MQPQRAAGIACDEQDGALLVRNPSGNAGLAASDIKLLRRRRRRTRNAKTQ